MSRFNTGNPIGSGDVKDLSDNAKNLDVAENSVTEMTWRDRFGRNRKTMHGMEVDSANAIQETKDQADRVIANLGFFVPIPYAPGLEVETPNFTVTHEGVTYAAHAGQVPFTTGAWDPEQWYPIQNEHNDNKLLVFQTLVEAENAAKTLPDGQMVVVSEFNGVLSKYKVSSGALVFDGVIGLSTVETTTDTNKNMEKSDSGKYLRFVSNGLKTVDFSSLSNFIGGEEFEISNRSTYGQLVVNTNDIAMNSVYGEPLRLSQGDTVKIKAVNSNELDFVYGSTSPYQFGLPVIPNENSTFNDEGDSASGWVATGASLSVMNSYLRATKTGAIGEACSISKPWTFTPENRDYILYGKVRASAISEFDATVISIYNGTKEVAIWLGYTGNEYTVGAASIVGQQSVERRVATITTNGLAYNTTDIEFALQYDSKFGQLNCWFRETDGRWKLKARVNSDFVSHTSIMAAKHSDAPNGSWFEFDYLTLCQPNIIAIGDSHCAGATLFDPNLGLDLSNDESSWMRHSNPYPNIRNNLIVNKGIGAESSLKILNRITEVTRENPRVVFLHASSNDEADGVSLQSRTINIQNTVNAITTAGESVLLLNALYATSTHTGNPKHRDYMRSWWAKYRLQLRGLYGAVDITQPVNTADGFLNPIYAQPDTVHLNPIGYDLVGKMIESGPDMYL
jgi:lysophospholipase L1-like esterase